MTSMQLPEEYFQKPILLSPHYSNRPWGGNRLRDVLGKDVPFTGGPFGESWELSDHPDGRSLTGKSIPFGDVIRHYPMQMIGREDAPEKYPLLVKYIDADGDLSVQVHPDDAWCAEARHPDRGKSECWFVMDCEPGARMVFGYKPGVTEARAREALLQCQLTDHLAFHPIQPGDFITVPPRTVHAILAGTLICEVQQSSNTTFRLYDWDRKPARQLHVEESMQVTEFDCAKLPKVQHFGKTISENGWRKLLENEFFEINLLQLTTGQPSNDIGAPENTTGLIVNVVAGSGEMGGLQLKRGQTLFLPAAMKKFPGAKAGDQGLRLLVSRSLEI